MHVISYFDSNNKSDLMKKIAQCDWSAARFLVELLQKGTFHETLGGWGELYLLMDGEDLVSFATFTGQDAVRDETLTPWIGFVYTVPAYRGHRYAGRVLAHAEAVAAEKGHSRVYIATDHVGLYEKYGYGYQENRIDCWGSDQRVLVKDLSEKENLMDRGCGVEVTEITDLTRVYAYQMGFQVPYFFSTDFARWKVSFENDTDGEGRRLFQKLYGKAAFDGGRLIGFIQYGNTAFGFDDCGEISAGVSYPVIRSLYFDEGREDAGRLLLQEAMQEFAAFDKVYAFFHYFGMSCFARHGKLFEHFGWIKELLHEYGFEIEHENVYYSALLQADVDSEVEIIAQRKTKGSQQTFDFILDQEQIGGCEVHYLDTKENAYLRWIYVNEQLQNRGVGTKCMNALKKWLRNRGITRLDTDTALNNHRAQRYYEKNGFTREGVTRSFYLTRKTKSRE